MRLQFGHGPGGHGRRGGPRALAQAFGVQVGRFQQIETLLTDMEVRLATCAPWCTGRRCIDAADETERLDVALMKALRAGGLGAGGLGRHADSGGLGYTEGSRVSRIWEDCRGNQIAEGTDQVMVYIAAP
ncbi:MAG: acyl-CoA dehydrogenase family protein [Eggerthella lenta]